MTALAHPSHPVTAAVASARAALGAVADVPVWSMDAGQVTKALDELAAHEAQTAALRSRLIMQAEAVEAPESVRCRHRTGWPAVSD